MNEFDIVQQNIWSENNYEYDFNHVGHDDIYDWLVNECIWNYTIYSISFKLTGVWYLHDTVLTFLDINGSIEFKLRFM